MGSFFSSPDPVKPPPPPPPPKEDPKKKAQEQPSYNSPEVQQAVRDAREKARMRQGRGSTILTSAQGLSTEEENNTRKTLLGA